jgi:hypothetical protein
MEEVVTFPDAKLRKPLAAWAALKVDDPAAGLFQHLTSPDYIQRCASCDPARELLAFILETTQ